MTTVREPVRDPLAEPDPSTPPRSGATFLRSLAAGQVARFSGVYLWAGIILVFGLWVPNDFLTKTTVTAIAGDQAITVIVALGLLCSLSAGAFDLSIAVTLGLTAVITAKMMAAGHGLVLTLAVVLLAGLLTGVTNGVLVSVVGVNSFIATLGVSSVLTAVIGILTNGQYVGPIPMSAQHVATAQPHGFPILTVYALIAAVLVWYVIQHLPVGRRLQATGANPEASRLAGVRTKWYTFGGLVAGSMIAGVAGMLLALKIGTVSPDVGTPYLLPAFAGCFLGTTQFKSGRLNVWGTVLALYLLATGVKGLQLVGGPTWVTDMFNGVALIGAVSIAVIAARRRSATA